MAKKGITKYMLHKEYHVSKAQLSRLQHNEGVSMNTINTLCNILDGNIEDIATHYKYNTDRYAEIIQHILSVFFKNRVSTDGYAPFVFSCFSLP